MRQVPRTVLVSFLYLEKYSYTPRLTCNLTRYIIHTRCFRYLDILCVCVCVRALCTVSPRQNQIHTVQVLRGCTVKEQAQLFVFTAEVEAVEGQ